MVKCRDCKNAKIISFIHLNEEETLCKIADEKAPLLNPDEERECQYYKKKGFYDSQYSNFSNTGMIACIAVGVIMLVLGLLLFSIGLNNGVGIVGAVVAFIGLFLVAAPFMGK